jgi:DNA replication protein DnaC
MDYNKVKKEIFNLVLKNQSVFITGAAGVGKTHMIRELFNELKEKGHNVALTSTTGTNAMVLGGMTIHKFMGLTIHTNPNYIKFMKSSFLFTGIKKRLAKFDIIVIDEISMLRGDQFELICAILKEAGDPTKDFGGKTMIFTGDFYQIPPVVKS